MKNNILTLLFSLFILSIVNGQIKPKETNDFYDNDTLFSLGKVTVEIAGEIANPGPVDFSQLPLHQEIVKEALLNEKGDTAFVGAYRYDGYSLYDILNDRVIQKKNEKEFNPIIDLYVEVENDKGEKVVFSWGEIYYPINRHKIIIAMQVMRIVPSKTKDLWPLPTGCKVVAATDLLTERNIYNPVKITVKSYPKSFTVTRDMEDLYSNEIKIYKKEQQLSTFTGFPSKNIPLIYHSVFYGKGRGIHGISTFNGMSVKELLWPYFSRNKSNIRQALILVVAKDGYRSVFTYSEVFNRNDFQDFLLNDRSDDKKNGAFSIFPAPDFFSDRAVKGITAIYLTE
ncbi:MAG: hypothetical protein BWY70_00127 [Bacteroidetes bacterium ADurb.Bin408]|nr:MAG: hypothetical protein BWY70_00127 [Bacteroidetes bacterium ADurb.Bin408]